jgi:hypothetical protein
MTQKMARIFSLGTCILLLVSLFSWPIPVSAGLSEWSAETIPSRLDNMLGPAGIDIRDFAIGNDAQTLYAAAGNSANNDTQKKFIYKSIDGGITWTELTTPIRVDYVAIAPDDVNTVVIASNSTPIKVYYRSSSTVNWQSLGDIPGGNAPATIRDLAISPLRLNSHLIAVAGSNASGGASLWYYDPAPAIQTWNGTTNLGGFIAANETATFAFSPYFASDSIIFAITDNTTSITNINSKDVKLQILKLSASTWNTAAGFSDFPHTIVSSNITRLISASLALSPYFRASDPDSYQALIGLTIDGTPAAKAASGIYRLDDTDLPCILTDTKIHSIAFDGVHLIAGAYNTNAVYYSANPFSVSPTIRRSAITKSPGGENKTVVAWMGDSVIAGTSGNESAFAISEDNGSTFNDISLIDTDISIARDVAVSNDGNKVYLISENNTDTSVWCFDTTWRRVFSQNATTDFTVHIAPSNSSTVYLTKKGTTTVYYNNASGTTPWLSRNCNINIQDMAVASSQVVYVIDAAGVVSKSTTNGLLWNTTSSTNLTSGATIVSVSTNIVLAGSQDGYVSYTLNGGASWTKISQIVEPSAGNVTVAADTNFAVNKIIYAASDKPHSNIMKWTIGASNTWTDIFDGNINGGIYGLVATNNVLYALEYNAGQSTLWRHLFPATAPAASIEWTPSSTDTGIILNAAPQALKESSDKLWAVNTSTAIGKLYSYTDVIINIEIALLYPIEGYLVHVNSVTYLAYDVSFSWERPSIATGYELLIAQDKDFINKVATISVNMTDEIAYVIVGPNQAGAAKISFSHGTAYYWKVRTTKPSYSPYSETRTFTIDPLPAMAFEAVIQIQEDMITGVDPTFSWYPLQGITEYELTLSDNPAMISPIIDTFIESTAFKPNITLKYGETYFWHVRATKPVYSDWSTMGTFSVTKRITAPLPPLIIEEDPPETTTIMLTAPPNTVFSYLFLFSTPGYLIFTIFILIILLVAVIFLIAGRFPGRLFAFASQTERLLGLFRKMKEPGAEPVRPVAKPEPRVKIPRTPATPETTAPHPALMEKDKEGAAVIFAAKSFMWMVTQEKGTDEDQGGLSEKERQSLGKKLAAKIHDLTKKESLYIKYQEDTSMLLGIWAQYGSRNETNDYLTKSSESNPENAIRLLKCYLPAARPDKAPPSADDFTMAQYNSLAEVVDLDKIYAALTKLFKFKAATIEEKMPIKPADRNLATQFIHLHHEAKNQK